MLIPNKGLQFNVTVIRCRNISNLLWQHISVLLGHLQACIQEYKVQSALIMHCGIPYYLQSLLIFYDFKLFFCTLCKLTVVTKWAARDID